jgi:DNA polymerase I-like protein with 3'-5' exonuclease and polymerase domains
MVLREPKNDITFRHDIHKLKRVLDGQYPPHDIEHVINPSFNEAMAWLDKMQDERMPVSYDIETIAGETACIGFANDPHVGMCIAFRGLKHNVYSREEELLLRRRAQALVGDPNVRLVAQNGNFDAYWLWYKDRIGVRANWFDTLLAHHTLYSTLPHNLGYLTAQYTTHPYYKDDKQGWKEGGDIDRFWRYNVKDVCITLECQRKLLEELRDAQQDKFFFDHVMRLQPHLTRMTVQGVPLDMELKQHIAETLAADVYQLKMKFQQEARAATGETEEYEPNPNSPQQVSTLLFRKLKLVGRGTSTDETNRKRMIEHPRTPTLARQMLRTLNTFKEEAKFAGTYAEMETDADGRARTEYKQYGTQTAPGRLSSTQVMWGTGGNFQNQPQRAQPMFVAPNGYGFGYFDLAQAEARYVGWDAQIDQWIEQFERARVDGVFDCHRALAADMFGIPYDEVPTFDHVDVSAGKIVEGLEDHAPTQRYIAKRCRHGLNYRMNWPKLAETANLSLRDAERAYNVYHRLTPQLRQWWDKLTAEVTKNKTLFNAYGRRLVIIERITDEALESIVAFKPQSTIGDKVSRVIYQSEEDDEWPEHSRIVLNIHDALVAVAPLDKIKTCLRIMKRYAEEPLYIHGRELIVPADLKQSVPIRWEMDEKTHAIKYIKGQGGSHRWYGMEKVVL